MSTLPGGDERLPSVQEPPEGPTRTDDGRFDFLTYLGRKLFAAVLNFFVLLVIGFVMFSLIPADPVQTLTRGHRTSAAQMEQIRESLGLDKPLWARFLDFVNSTLHGDLGRSWQFQQSVSSLIGERLWPTVLLMGTATVISVLLGLWLGIRAGWRHGSRLDRVASAVSLTLWSVPTFWLGLILLVTFSVGIGPIPSLFPANGMSDPTITGGGAAHVLDVARHLVLPAMTMVLVIFAQYVTIMRSSIIDELGSPYLLTARAKGLRDSEVRRRHAVPNAMLPTVTVVFLQVGVIISGAITVEVVYSWPGLGYLTYQALNVPDLPVLQGTFILFSASVIVMNLIADVLYRFLDPRVRAQ
ncbi:MAG: ABC transporter permease [Nocardioidaceae bacterium]